MKNFHDMDTQNIFKYLDSNEMGITEKVAKERLQVNGLNKLKEEKKRNIFLKFIDQFKNVMTIILLIAATLSFIVSFLEKEPITDTVIILAVVMINAILGVVQESRAEKAIDALKKMSLPYIKVRRDGKILSIKTEELVVGDIVLIEAGDYIPADMRIIENNSLRVDESALTGESMPVDKKLVVIDDEKTALADRVNMLYSSSSVVYGRGEGIVVATGMDTEIGKIATALSSSNVEVTPLQKKMGEISKVLSVLVVIISIIMVIVGIINGDPIIDVFMIAIALAVAAIPEGLATVITITLAIGVQKMAEEKSLIRKLSAVETLGCTEIICSDKTGTLTENKMTVVKCVYNNKEIQDISKTSNNYVNSLMLCNDSKYDSSNILIGDPTETAIISYMKNNNYDKNKFENEFKRIDEKPFDSERKMMSTVNTFENKEYVYTKGAFESIIKVCNKIEIDNEIVDFTDKLKEKITNININMATKALRVLAFAYKEKDNKNLEKDLIFLGLVGMIDPPRKEAAAAVKSCYSAGMTPIMITGDNIDTAMAIAKNLNILKENDQAITGIELDELTDEELEKRIFNIKVYARVSPENKRRIVKTFKKLGKIVAMTGDGVNDAPALKGADIGIGMGITGTEVSKSVSSMILADDNFATIVVAVKEGRRIYDNIQNVIAYLLSSNLAEVLIVFFATLFGQHILLPIQLLWINLVTDTIPAIALGFENPEKNIMRRKPRNSKENFFNKFLIFRITVPAVIKSIFVFIVYIVISNNYSSVVASSSAFLTLALMEVLYANVCRSDKKSIINIGVFNNKAMVISSIFAISLQLFMVLNPHTSLILSATGINLSILIFVISIVILAFIILESYKLMLAKIFKK